ncbi:hypothetical protein [Brumimicrobium salinarum]|uniref:hypothetical protein n=1 Tax=Brumimicrobium salinarum TaxID=2058658 RepID=UPI0010565737|nr:hypothetical protein [Brumimicrobium salinarum]
MNLIRILIVVVAVLTFSSCIELIEDTKINSDGSGTYKVTLNLSSSTTRVNAIMALDSIDGKKVPSKTQLKEKFKEYLQELSIQQGITNVEGDLNTTNWIVNLSCDFASLNHLKNSLVSLGASINKNQTSKNIENIRLTYNDHVYTRFFGSFITNRMKNDLQKDKDYGRLSEGKFVFIQRFEKPVQKVSSSQAIIAKNNKAVMLKLNPQEIIKNPELLNYKIFTNP